MARTIIARATSAVVGLMTEAVSQPRRTHSGLFSGEKSDPQNGKFIHEPGSVFASSRKACLAPIASSSVCPAIKGSPYQCYIQAAATEIPAARVAMTCHRRVSIPETRCSQGSFSSVSLDVLLRRKTYPAQESLLSRLSEMNTTWGFLCAASGCTASCSGIAMTLPSWARRKVNACEHRLHNQKYSTALALDELTVG